MANNALVLNLRPALVDSGWVEVCVTHEATDDNAVGRKGTEGKH